MADAFDRLKQKYIGPGGPEWLFGFACAVLIADNLSDYLNAGKAQTAAAYYFQTPPISLFHGLALAINGLILISIITWIIRPSLAKFTAPTTFILAILGFALIWAELTVASTLNDPRFTLNGLPYDPINNAGIIGATIFLTYSIFKLPVGTLKKAPATFIKFAFAISLLMTQLMVYEQFQYPTL